MFLNGQEQIEAQQLWDAVKGMAETQVEKTENFPIFDHSWFVSLLRYQNQPPVASPEESSSNLKPPYNLPAPVNNFFGREKELSLIHQLLLSTTPLITLTGVGGIGKTRPAQESAENNYKDFKDGVWLVELAPLTRGEQVVAEVAALLGVKEEAGEDLAFTLKKFLRPKKLLLLVDNCEHLKKAAPVLVYDLITSCPGLKIIATSREKLAVPGESILKVSSLSFPESHQISSLPQIDLLQLRDYEAVQLFEERARAFQPDFALTVHNVLWAAQICKQLDGIPLAIELAAARTRLLSVEQLNRHLSDRFRLLTGGSRAKLPRQQTLQALIDWSYDLLKDEEQALFRRLAVFVEDFSLEAVEVVCTGENIDLIMILDLIAELAGKSLLKAETYEKTMRYRMLETIRQYSLEKLEQKGEKQHYRENHLNYYLGFTNDIQIRFGPLQNKEKLNLLEREYPNLRVALDWAIFSQDSEKALELSVNIGDFWDGRGYYGEGRAYLQRCLSLTNSTTSSKRSKALITLASLAEVQGDHQEGIGYAQESLEVARQSGDKPGMANSLYELGKLNVDKGNYQAARDYIQQALLLQRETGNKLGIAICLKYLGFINFYQSDYKSARAYYEEALDVFRQIGDMRGECVVLNNLGNIALDQADYEGARLNYEEALKLARELDSPVDMAANLSNLGIVAQNQGDYKRAEEYYLQGLILHRKLGHKRFMVNVGLNLGDLTIKQGKYPAALDYTEEALGIAREINYKFGEAICLKNLGEITINLGDYAAARDYLQESLKLREELENIIGIASSLYSLGNVSLLRGEYSLADTYYRRSLDLRRQISEKRGVADCLKNLALLANIQKEYEQGTSYLRESLVEGTNLNSSGGFEVEFLAVLIYGLVRQDRQKAEAAQLAGVVESLLSRSGPVLSRLYLRVYREAVELLMADLAPAKFEAKLLEGKALDLGEVLKKAKDLI